MSTSARKRLFKNKPVEFQLEMFKLAEQFLSIQKQINQKASNFDFTESPFITYIGNGAESDLRDTLIVAKEGFATKTVSLDKIRFRIEVMERQAEDQKNITSLLRECDNLTRAAAKIPKEPSDMQGLQEQSFKRERQDSCDELEEHVFKVLRACKRLKGTEEQDDMV